MSGQQQLPTIKVLEFKTEYIKAKDGKPAREIEWVRYTPIHAAGTSSTWERVSVMRPPEEIDEESDSKKYDFIRHRWSMIEPAYEAWKGGHDIPVNGTPLALWGGVNQEQARIFRTLGIKTVEEVAAITDVVIQKLPFPNARALPSQARAFLEAADRTAAAERVAEQDARLAEQDERLRELMAEIAALKSDKPRRGRPPKTADAVDEEEAA